jgi:hypothetical protein
MMLIDTVAGEEAVSGGIGDLDQVIEPAVSMRRQGVGSAHAAPRGLRDLRRRERPRRQPGRSLRLTLVS